MKEGKLRIHYKVGGHEYVDDAYQNEHYNLVPVQGDHELKLTLVPTQKMELVSFSITYDHAYQDEDWFFVNGYQSWSTSREYKRGEKLLGLTPLTNVLSFAKTLASTSGDYSFKAYPKCDSVFHSYTYTYIRCGEKVVLVGSLSEKFGYTIFNADMNQNRFMIEKEVEGLVVDASYPLLDVICFRGGYDEVFDRYFRAWGVGEPRFSHLAGYTSWYNYFQEIDESIIYRDLEGLTRAKNANVFQVDDGYQPFVGDWLDKNDTDFPNGMKAVADRVHQKGLLAGIWLAPFSVQKKSRIAKEHPDWLIKNNKNGKPLLGCVGWGGAYTLDIYNQEVQAYLKKVFDVVLNEWGFDMVKLDFLYSQCMQPRDGKTRGTIMCDGMEFLRSCVGDKLLLGCGVPLGPSFGLVDCCRISCDVDPKYTGKFYEKLHINREIPSAQNAITSTVFRRHLNGRVFINDPDVFFLRDFNLSFTKQQKELLARVNNLCGNVLFVSDDVGKYGEEELALVQKAFEKSTAKIKSASLEDHFLKMVYQQDGKEETLRFHLPTGETDKPIKW